MAVANMLSPGVEITEVDYSEYIRQASTSTIGMVGGATKGPITPTLITNKNQAIKIFGEPTAKDFGVYSLLGALDHADRVYYRRIVKERSVARVGDYRKDRLIFSSIGESSIYNNIVVILRITKFGIKPDESDYVFDVTIRFNEMEEKYENCTTYDIEEKINGISELVSVEVQPYEDVTMKSGVYRMKGGATGCSYATTPETDDVNFASKTYDSTMNGYTIVLSEPNFMNLFSMKVLDRFGETVEELSGLSLDPYNERYIETYINNYSDYITCSYNPDTEVEIWDKEYKLSGGSNGIDGLDDDSVNEGLDDFSNPEIIDIDILCNPGWSDRSILEYGISIAEGRQDCIYIMDPPFGLKPTQVIDWSNGTGTYAGTEAFDSSYAAIYYPWVKVWDAFSSDYVWLPPSGYIAGQMSYNDQVGQTWFAPAGLNRGVLSNISDIEFSPTKEERDQLYGNLNVINPLMNFRGKGFVIWGQKTTQRKYTALDRVNVRRLINYMKKIISASSAYYVFEPNDKYCWERWKAMVQPKLEGIKAARGLYDYRIIMDETTVTDDDIDNNRMPGIIMFKPTKTAEFIPLEFIIMRTGASFDETLVDHLASKQDNIK